MCVLAQDQPSERNRDNGEWPVRQETPSPGHSALYSRPKRLTELVPRSNYRSNGSLACEVLQPLEDLRCCRDVNSEGLGLFRDGPIFDDIIVRHCLFVTTRLDVSHPAETEKHAGGTTEGRLAERTNHSALRKSSVTTGVFCCSSALRRFCQIPVMVPFCCVPAGRRLHSVCDVTKRSLKTPASGLGGEFGLRPAFGNGGSAN
jgi:hypothetical protein